MSELLCQFRSYLSHLVWLPKLSETHARQITYINMFSQGQIWSRKVQEESYLFQWAKFFFPRCSHMLQKCVCVNMELIKVTLWYHVWKLKNNLSFSTQAGDRFLPYFIMRYIITNTEKNSAGFCQRQSSKPLLSQILNRNAGYV